MANVLGKEVSDGSHNVIYRTPQLGEVAALTVEQVTSLENVRYKMAGTGEIATAIVEFTNGTSTIITDGANTLTDGVNTLAVA